MTQIFLLQENKIQSCWRILLLGVSSFSVLRSSELWDDVLSYYLLLFYKKSDRFTIRKHNHVLYKYLFSLRRSRGLRKPLDPLFVDLWKVTPIVFYPKIILVERACWFLERTLDDILWGEPVFFYGWKSMVISFETKTSGFFWFSIRRATGHL